MLRAGPILAALLLSLPAPALAAGSDQAAFASLQAVDLEVAGIAWRLISANSARCPQKMAGTGLLLHTLNQYPVQAQESVLAIAPFPSLVSVLGVIPQSPAALAGLRTGDGIEAINGTPVSQLTIAGTHPSARRDAAERALLALPPSAPIELLIKRGQTTRTVTLASIPVCRLRLEVLSGSRIKARSDGELIQIGESFAARIGKDGIAVVLAHELGHTIGRHHRLLAANGKRGGRRARLALARQFEDEADLIGLDLLAGAGWNPAMAPRFLRHFAAEFDPPRPLRSVYRPARDRAALMERALDLRQP